MKKILLLSLFALCLASCTPKEEEEQDKGIIELPVTNEPYTGELD